MPYARQSNRKSGWFHAIVVRLTLFVSVFLMMEALFPSLAHAGKRGFPLFIVISDNPVLLAIGGFLFVGWLIFRMSDN